MSKSLQIMFDISFILFQIWEKFFQFLRGNEKYDGGQKYRIWDTKCEFYNSVQKLKNKLNFSVERIFLSSLLWAWLCHPGGEASNREGRGKCEVDGEELSDYLDVDEDTEYKAELIKGIYDHKIIFSFINIYIFINIHNSWVLYSCL